MNVKDADEIMHLFKEKSGARQAGLCPSVPLQSGRAPKVNGVYGGMRSLLVGIFPYFVADTPGNLCLYARGKDYHDVLQNRLVAAKASLEQAFPHNRFYCGCDCNPVNEVLAALRAGLGVRGDNGLFISEIYGSFVFIGTVATDIAFDMPDAPLRECLHCGACKKACPTGALSDKENMRIKCLSAITQKKGELSEAEEDLMRRMNTAWGCDACQRACPYNKNATVDPLPEFRKNLICNLPRELLQAGEEEAQTLISGRAFAWRGTEVLKRNLRVLNR